MEQAALLLQPKLFCFFFFFLLCFLFWGIFPFKPCALQKVTSVTASCSQSVSAEQRTCSRPPKWDGAAGPRRGANQALASL